VYFRRFECVNHRYGPSLPSLPASSAGLLVLASLPFASPLFANGVVPAHSLPPLPVSFAPPFLPPARDAATLAATRALTASPHLAASAISPPAVAAGAADGEGPWTRADNPACPLAAAALTAPLPSTSAGSCAPLLNAVCMV